MLKSLQKWYHMCVNEIYRLYFFRYIVIVLFSFIHVCMAQNIKGLIFFVMCALTKLGLDHYFDIDDQYDVNFVSEHLCHFVVVFNIEFLLGQQMLVYLIMLGVV